MDLICKVLFIVCMFLWLLTAMPFPQAAPYAPARTLLAWFSVLFLGLLFFMGASIGFAR
jgi:hypothetical protein